MMAMLHVSFTELAIIAVVVLLPLLLVLGLVFAAIKHKNWGGILVAIVFVGGVVMMALLYVGFAPFQPIKSAFVDTLHAARLSNQSPIAAPVVPRAPTAEVVSDEELAAVASAQPKIKLEEIDAEVEVTEDEAADKADNTRSDRPDWIDAHLGDNQKLITSGPFTTKETCEADTQKQITNWLDTRYFPRGSAIDSSDVIKSQHAETRVTSVGEMHFLYTLAEVTPEVETQIAKSLAEAAAQTARNRGFRAVAFGGAGVLSLVALTHVVLRSGGRKNP